MKQRAERKYWQYEHIRSRHHGKDAAESQCGDEAADGCLSREALLAYPKARGFARRCPGLVAGNLSQGISLVDSFKGNSSLFSWLYRIATNVVLSSLRSKHPEGTQLDEVRGMAADSYFEFSDEEAVALQRAIHSLPPKQQAVFNMRYYDEMSFKEIADINDCSENSAKANYHFAKTKIVELMKRYITT